MAELVKSGRYLFDRKELDDALARTLPHVPADKSIVVAGGVYKDGAKIALVYTRPVLGGDLQFKTAFEHDWTGDDRFGVGFTFTK